MSSPLHPLSSSEPPPESGMECSPPGGGGAYGGTRQQGLNNGASDTSNTATTASFSRASVNPFVTVTIGLKDPTTQRNENYEDGKPLPSVEEQLTKISQKLLTLIATTDKKRAEVRARLLNDADLESKYLDLRFFALEQKVAASEHIKNLEGLQQDIQRLQSSAADEKESRENELKSQSEIFKEELFKEIVALLETEFNCVVCSEVFIQPSVIDCGHTFCSFCINHWMKEKKECPICRQVTLSCTKHVEMDNFVTKIHSMLSQEIQCKRRDLVAERETVVKTTEAASQRSSRRVLDIRRLIADEVDVLYNNFIVEDLRRPSNVHEEFEILMHNLDNLGEPVPRNPHHPFNPFPSDHPVVVAFEEELHRDRLRRYAQGPSSLAPIFIPEEGGHEDSTATVGQGDSASSAQPRVPSTSTTAATGSQSRPISSSTSTSAPIYSHDNNRTNMTINIESNHIHGCPYFSRTSTHPPTANNPQSGPSTGGNNPNMSCPHLRGPPLFGYNVPIQIPTSNPYRPQNLHVNHAYDPRRPPHQGPLPPPAHQNAVGFFHQNLFVPTPQQAPLMPAHMGPEGQQGYNGGRGRIDPPLYMQQMASGRTPRLPPPPPGPYMSLFPPTAVYAVQAPTAHRYLQISPSYYTMEIGMPNSSQPRAVPSTVSHPQNRAPNDVYRPPAPETRENPVVFSAPRGGSNNNNNTRSVPEIGSFQGSENSEEVFDSSARLYDGSSQDQNSDNQNFGEASAINTIDGTVAGGNSSNSHLHRRRRRYSRHHSGHSGHGHHSRGNSSESNSHFHISSPHQRHHHRHRRGYQPPNGHFQH